MNAIHHSEHDAIGSPLHPCRSKVSTADLEVVFPAGNAIRFAVSGGWINCKVGVTAVTRLVPLGKLNINFVFSVGANVVRSTEYATIKADYDQISRTYFPKSYFFPEGMSFARSDALFPQPALASVVGPEYEAQCRMLCYGPYPSWDNVQNRFLEMRDIL